MPLGTLLVRAALLTPDQLEQALAEKEQSGTRLGEVVVERGWVEPAALARALADQYGLGFLDLDEEELDTEVTRLLPEPLARRYEALPIRFIGPDLILVGVADPTNILTSDDLRLALGTNIQLAVVAKPDLDRAFARLFRAEIALEVGTPGDETEQPRELDEIQNKGSDVPTINLVNSLLHRAIEDGASDIHFEPQARELQVRMRVDGVMRPMVSVPKHMQASVGARLKVMGELDIAERRMPQDGRVSVRFGGQPIDIRIAILPTTHGEQAVLRIFQRSSRRFSSLDELGMNPRALADFGAALRQPFGLIICCGPTGSGKTTTLYGALEQLNTHGRVLQTIEDPVEYQIPGIAQCEVNVRSGLTFSKGLRSLLRSDPDVILVGEVRDEETARIAAQAAMTGHLVLSSLHVHSAASAIARLKDLGVEPELLATTLNSIVAQRLVRRLCKNCREAYQADSDELAELGVPAPDAGDVTLYRAKGCVQCANTGYAGRVGLYEVLPVRGQVRRLMEASTEAILEAALAAGMITLRQDGNRVCLEGISSLDEVRRVTGFELD